MQFTCDLHAEWNAGFGYDFHDNGRSGSPFIGRFDCRLILLDDFTPCRSKQECGSDGAERTEHAVCFSDGVHWRRQRVSNSAYLQNSGTCLAVPTVVAESGSGQTGQKKRKNVEADGDWKAPISILLLARRGFPARSVSGMAKGRSSVPKP